MDLGGLGGMFGGGNGGGMPMGGILPMLMNGQGMGLLQMMQGQGRGGQGQNGDPGSTQQPSSWLQPYGNGGNFLGGMGAAPTMAQWLQGRGR